LFVNEELWKGYGLAEDDTFQCSRSEDGKSYITICSWNISKGLVLKLEDGNFLQIVHDYDVLCLSECWVKCPNDFKLSGYEKKHIFREKCNGGVVVVFYRKCLSQYIKFVACCSDS
jgi:hypothetical protein